MSITVTPKRPKSLERKATPKTADAAQKLTELGKKPADTPRPNPSTPGNVLFLAIENIHPHPLNPGWARITPAVVKARAESLEREGQLEPLRVRVAPPHWNLPLGHYQLLSGETRWAAADSLGWTELQAVIEPDCDDVRALQLLSVFNSQRTDLDKIAIGEAIVQLRKPVDEGGAGMTCKQAAELYAISESEASNLCRLAGLPEPWRSRVISGEMEPTKARELLPYLGLKPIAKLLDEDYRAWSGKTHDNLAKLDSSCTLNCDLRH